MKIQVVSVGSVWFGKTQIAICPWRGNEANTYYTLAQVRRVARDFGYTSFASSEEIERFAREMFQKERRRKNAPVSRLLCFKHRSRIRRSASSGRLARSEILHVPTLYMDPHPSNPGVRTSVTSRLSWGEETAIKAGGKIYISPFELMVFSK